MRNWKVRIIISFSCAVFIHRCITLYSQSLIIFEVILVKGNGALNLGII